MGVVRQPLTPRVRPRHVLLVGAVVVGWRVGRAGVEAVAAPRVAERPAAPPVPVEAASQARRSRGRRPVRIALAGARAPLFDAAAAGEHAQAAKQAEAARLRLV